MLNYQRVNCVIWGQSSYPWILSSALVSAAAGTTFWVWKLTTQMSACDRGAKDLCWWKKRLGKLGVPSWHCESHQNWEHPTRILCWKQGVVPLPKYHIAPHQSLGGVYWSCAFGMETKTPRLREHILNQSTLSCYMVSTEPGLWHIPMWC